MTDQDPTEVVEVRPAAEAVEPPQTATEPSSSTPTEPVVRAGSQRAGRSPLRWAVAIVASVLVVGATAGATLMLTSDASDPDVLAWTPKDSVVYTELRLDLPGDQTRQLGRFLSAFPGFDDQAILDTKLGEVYDRIVRGATEGRYDYRTDIDPWFGGQLSMSVGPLPAAADLETAKGRALVVASVDDAAAAAAWVAGVVAETGATTGTESHAGTSITIVEPPADRGHGERMTGAYAVVGPVLVLGDLDSVKAAIDTRGTGGLGSAAEFATAEGSVPGDRLAFAYLDTDAFLAWGEDVREGIDTMPMPSMPTFLTELTPGWTAGAVRAAEGDLVIDGRAPHVDALGAPENHASRIASLAPPSTVVLVAGHDVGATIDRYRELVRQDAEGAKALEEIEGAANLIGGLDAAVGWLGDVGVVVTADGPDAAGGLLVTPTDAEAAGRFLTTLRGFATLGGGQAGIDIEISDESYAGATVTTVSIGGLRELAGEASDAEMVPERIDLAYTVTDEVVVLGSSPAFAKAVLDARDGPSLADEPRFADLVGRAGAEHAALHWLDLARGRTFVEGLIPAGEEREEYESEVKPYVEALDAILGTHVEGDEIDASTLIISVTE